MSNEISVLTCRESSSVHRTCGNKPFNRVYDDEGNITNPGRPRWTRWNDIDVIDNKFIIINRNNNQLLPSPPKSTPRNNKFNRKINTKKDINGSELYKDIEESIDFINNIKSINDPRELHVFNVLRNAYNSNNVSTFSKNINNLPPIKYMHNDHSPRGIKEFNPEFDIGVVPLTNSNKISNITQVLSSRRRSINKKDKKIHNKKMNDILKYEIKDLKNKIKDNKEDKNSIFHIFIVMDEILKNDSLYQITSYSESDYSK